MRPTYVIPISVICCVALFPAKSTVPPYSASLHRLRHPVFELVLFFVTFVFIFMIIVIIFDPLSLPYLGTRVSSLPHQLDIEKTCLVFRALCRCSLFVFFFFSCLPSGLIVPSFCWSIT